jgi:hypothetical protein
MVEQQGKPRLCAGRLHVAKVRQVLRVERDDVVEGVEVGRRDLTGAQIADVDPVTTGSRNCAGIGRAADVPVARARAVDPDGEAETLRLCAEGGLGKRGATDVSRQTNSTEGGDIDSGSVSLPNGR